MDSYGTHIGLLTCAAMHTTGPILEIGCGDYSTPILHGICSKSNRKLVSVETKLDWFKKFKRFETSWHNVRFAKEEHETHKLQKRWGLVFIDGPDPTRSSFVKLVAKISDVVLIHDTDLGYRHNLRLYEFIHDEKVYNRWTTLASNNGELFSTIVRKSGSGHKHKPNPGPIKYKIRL